MHSSSSDLFGPLPVHRPPTPADPPAEGAEPTAGWRPSRRLMFGAMGTCMALVTYDTLRQTYPGLQRADSRALRPELPFAAPPAQRRASAALLRADRRPAPLPEALDPTDPTRVEALPEGIWRLLLPHLAAGGLPQPVEPSTTLDILKDPQMSWMVPKVQTMLGMREGHHTLAVGAIDHHLVKQPHRALHAGDRAIALSIFTADGSLDAELLNILDALRQDGNLVYAVIATEQPLNSIFLPPEQLAFFDAVLLRSHHGMDFAALAHLLQTFAHLWDADELLLTNSRALTQRSPEQVDALVRRLDGIDGDFVALQKSPSTEKKDASSWLFDESIWAVRRRGLQLPALQKFWLEDVYSLTDPAEIFQRYEQGLSQCVIESGLVTTEIAATGEPPIDGPSNPTSAPL